MQIVKAIFVNEIAAGTMASLGEGLRRAYSFKAPNEARVGEKWVAECALGLGVAEIVDVGIENDVKASRWLFQRVREEWLREVRERETRITELRAQAQTLIDTYMHTRAVDELCKEIPELRAIRAELKKLGVKL